MAILCAIEQAGEIDHSGGPAVEAGERLGFYRQCPEKIDPSAPPCPMRFRMLEARARRTYLEKNVIEIAPIAF